MKAIGSGRGAAALASGLLAGAVLFACGDASKSVDPSSAPRGGVVLARIGNEVVTTEDLGQLSPKANAGNRLETLIRRRLAVQEARHRGLENEPKVREEIDEIRRNAAVQEEALLRNALFNSIRLAVVVSEQDLRDHYEKTKERYVERQWALRMQGFPNEDAARAALAALGASGRLDPAQSEAPGPLPSDKLPDGVLTILHELVQPGDHQIVPLDRWTIVELVDYQPAAQLSFESVRPKVDLSLHAIRAEEQMRVEMDRLRSAMNVSVDQTALAAYVAEQTAKPPAAAATAPAAAPAADPAP